MRYSKKTDIFYIWTGRHGWIWGFLSSIKRYIYPRKKIKTTHIFQNLPAKSAFAVRCLRSDGWMRVKLNNTSNIMNGATKTHKHLGFTPKNPSFSTGKKWAGRLRDRKGRKKSPTHQQQTKNIFEGLLFFRTGTASLDVYEVIRRFWWCWKAAFFLGGGAFFFFLKLANSVFFFVLSFWVVVKNPDAIWELRPIFTWTGSLERTTTLIDDLWWFEGCCLSTWRGPWGPGCLEKPLGDFEEKTPQQVLTSALIPAGTWKFFQEVPSWEESESLLKGSSGASQEK